MKHPCTVDWDNGPANHCVIGYYETGTVNANLNLLVFVPQLWLQNKLIMAGLCAESTNSRKIPMQQIMSCQYLFFTISVAMGELSRMRIKGQTDIRM